MRRFPLIYINVPALRPGTLGGYGLALVSAGIATVLALAVDPYVIGVRFITFWPAVIITALISGFGAGLFCVVLSAIAMGLLVLPPPLEFYIEDRANVADFLLFLSLACFSVFIITEMRDAIEREQAERSLRESKERLQLALDAARLGWWQHDPRSRVGSGDARFKEIFDIAANDIPIEEIKDRVHPDDAERFWRDHLAKLDPTGPIRSTEEYRVRRRNGEVRWVRVCWLTYSADIGRERRVANIVGTAQDITEHKECVAREHLFAEREHLLARESAHRAKNLISVVGAIARQTTARNPADFIERFSERMQALSASQDLLVRNEWRGVEIDSLVHAQLAHFADLIGFRISVDGPGLCVKANAAEAIGLALHELATNAGKYGALSTDTGRVEICWRIDGETFTMSWTEREGPPVAVPQQRGFGTIVLEAMAERSVDGAVDLDYAPSGLAWRLTCPMVNVQEPRATEPAYVEG